MQKHRIRKVALSTAVAAVALAWAPGIASAQQSGQLDRIVNEANEINQVAQQSQQRIDDIATETQNLEQQYKSLLKEIEGLRAYNAQQERVIESQQAEIADLDRSITQVDAIKRQITPLMLRMIDGLDRFVRLDVPFLLEERTERVESLRELMDRSDVAEPEKFRRVLEAYQIENEYGRTIEAYRGTLDFEGAEREVSFLRVGRVVLAYQTLDGKVTGYWDKESGTWERLGDQYAGQIAEGIKIANRQSSPNLIRLPVTAPENAE